MLLLLAVACTGDPPRPQPGATPPQVRVIARGLHLFPGDDHAIRIAFQPASPTVFVRPEVEGHLPLIDVCPLRGITDPLPAEGCMESVPNGVRQPLTSAGMRVIAIRTSATPDPAKSTGDVFLDLVVDYDEGGRGLVLSIPFMPLQGGTAATCADNACNPVFEMVPTRGGPFTASARWEGREAVLLLLQGSVLARAQSATGLPYREPARDEGSSPLEIATRLTPRDEYALVFRQADFAGGSFRDVLIEATWP